MILSFKLKNLFIISCGGLMLIFILIFPYISGAVESVRSGQPHSILNAEKAEGNNYKHSGIILGYMSFQKVSGKRFSNRANFLYENPKISKLEDMTVYEDSTIDPIIFKVVDTTPPFSPSVFVSSSNTALVPNENMILGCCDESYTLTIILADNEYGSSEITVRVKNELTEITENFEITVDPVNDAPILTAGQPQMISIAANETNNAGMLISEIIKNSISDLDKEASSGIAVYSLNQGIGKWQYYIDDESRWINIDEVSESNALLLTSKDKIRFVPDGQNVAYEASFFYYAWDQTLDDYTAGNKADVSIRGNNTAFSINNDIAVIEVVTIYYISVLNVYPKNNSDNVSVITSIHVDFSDFIDDSTINSNFFVSDSFGELSGSFTQEDNTLIFTPDESLDYSTTYTVTINKNIKNTDGNSLETDYVWTFNTGSEEPANSPPSEPVAISPLNNAMFDEGPVVLKTSPFFDPDNDEHISTYWMVKRADRVYGCSDYNSSFDHTAFTADLTEHAVYGLDSGLEYVWKAGYKDSGSGQISWSQEYRFKIGKSIPGETVKIDAGTQVGNYKMVSFVQWPDIPLSQNVLQNDLGANYDTKNFKIGRYSPIKNAYIEYGNSLVIKPGRSYWFLARNGIDISVNGIPVSEAHDIEVELFYNQDIDNGWNMVGCPNNADYYWDEVKVVTYNAEGNIVEIKTISELDDDNPYIDKLLWEWEEGEYYSDTEIMKAYNGYWIKAKKDGIFLRFSTNARAKLSIYEKAITLLNTGKRLIKKLFLSPQQAIADAGDTPPMPMGNLTESSEDGGSGGCFISAAAHIPIESQELPSLTSSIRIKSSLNFCNEPVLLKNQEVRERLDKELLLTLWDRPQIILWIKRLNRYMPHIEHILKENNMPDDLKYVAIIESALRPHAGSSKGAMGFWQFMKATGKNYGLRINSNIDDRRNIFASTKAAIDYFNMLYSMFGSWTLAAASYNMGEQGLMTEILIQKTDNYYKLYLPLETQRYIFRIISAKLILSNPEKYGFKLTKDDLFHPLQFHSIKLKCEKETPIQLVAEAAKTYFKVIKDLNPEIRGYYLSEGEHKLLIPKGSLKGFYARYKKILTKWDLENKKFIYIVKSGDSLTSIANQFNVPMPALLIWNNLNLKKHIHPGDRLIVYHEEKEVVDEKN
ncbi:membrane-bound lytic murein transglycosylase D [Candidatus Magnetomoraceae bacterium gMMP-15]